MSSQTARPSTETFFIKKKLVTFTRNSTSTPEKCKGTVKDKLDWSHFYALSECAKTRLKTNATGGLSGFFFCA